MDNLPYPFAVGVLVVLALMAAFAVVVIYAYNDWIHRHDGPPSIADQVRLNDTLPVLDDTLIVPVVAPAPEAMPGALPETMPGAAPAPAFLTPAPALPVRRPAPLAREFVSDPVSHERALTEALFVAAQASCEPGTTLLLPVRDVAVDSVFAPPVDEHVRQALAAAHSHQTRPGYEAQHRASMA